MKCVSHSVHRGGGSLYNITSCLAAWSHSGKGVFVPGSMFLLEGDLYAWSHVPSWGSLSRGSLSGVSVQGSVEGRFCQEDLCPGVYLSRGGVSRGLCPAGSLSRGSLSGGDPRQRPPVQ